MEGHSAILERALELARSGGFISVNHVRQAMRKEGYTVFLHELTTPEANQALIAALRLRRSDQ